MPSNAIDYEAIRNTLSRYCMAIDSKKFDDLYAVLTPDVDANYAVIPGYENQRDWSALAENLKKTYTSQWHCSVLYITDVWTA